MAKPKTTDEVYEENAEVTPTKFQRKGTGKPPPKGKVKVTHKHSLGLNLMDKAQLIYFTTTGLIGEFMLYQNLSDVWHPEYYVSAMWAFGIATVVVALPALLRKRE